MNEYSPFNPITLFFFLWVKYVFQLTLKRKCIKQYK